MKVKRVKIPNPSVHYIPKGATVVKPELSVCEYCIYSGKDCPQVLTGWGDVVPSCKVFGSYAFFISDSTDFDEDSLAEI